MRILKIIPLGLVLLLVGCNHRPSPFKTVPKDSVSVTQNVKSIIPEWLIGTWKGDYKDESSDLMIHFVIEIKSDGSVIQSSSVEGEETEVLAGKCDAIDEESMSVTFQNMDDASIYYLNKTDKLLGISGNNWLKKQ